MQGREEPGIAKQANQTSHGQHTHTQQRQKPTRWKSVSTAARQACTTNQSNSNDFPVLLPYKGKGTPSAPSSWWLLLSLRLRGPRFQAERIWSDVVRSRGPAFLLCCQSPCVLTGVASSAASRCWEVGGRGHRGFGQPRSSTVTDRGSDSTFQMADITRRILQGALLLHQCVKEHTASYSPPSLPPPTSCLLPHSDPASVSVLKFQTIKTSNPKYEHVECMVNLCVTPLFSVSFLFFLTHSFPIWKKHPAYGYDHPSLSYFCPPTLLFASFFMSRRIRLCGKLFSRKYGVAPLTTQQKFAENSGNHGHNKRHIPQ